MTFKEELAELMDKWEVYLNWTCDPCSDLHGVSGEAMEIVDNQTRKVIFSVAGDTLSSEDLKNS